MERALIMSGIGGQGVQLAAQLAAHAAVLDGREVQLFGSYGGMMRGGDTMATVVVSDAAVESPPTVTDAAIGIVMHHDYADAALRRLAEDASVFVNSTIYEGPPVPGRRLDVPATEIAAAHGGAVNASMVMLGACCAATALVPLHALVASIEGVLPPYRRNHAAGIQDALRAGHDAGKVLCPA